MARSPWQEPPGGTPVPRQPAPEPAPAPGPPQQKGGPPPAPTHIYSAMGGGDAMGDQQDQAQPYQSPPYAPQQQGPYSPYGQQPYSPYGGQQPAPPPPPPPQMAQGQGYTPPEDQRIIAPEIYDPNDIGRSGYAKGTGPTRDWYGQDRTTGRSPQQAGLPPMPPDPTNYGPPGSPQHHQAEVAQRAWIYEGIRRGLTLADMGFQPAVGAGLALYKSLGENSGATLQQLQAEGPGAYGGPGGGGPNGSVIPNQNTPGGNAGPPGSPQVAPVFGGSDLMSSLLPFLLGSQGSPIKPGGYGSGLLADTNAPEYGLYGTQGNLMMQMMQMMQNRQGGGSISPYFTPQGTIGTQEASTPSTYTRPGG